MREIDRQTVKDLQANVSVMGRFRKEAFTLIDGVKVTHPFQTVEIMPYDAYIPRDVTEGYKVGKELIESMPPHWMEAIKEADFLKAQKGSDYPVDIIHGALRVTNNSQLAKELGISLPREKGFAILRREETASVIDAIIANPELRQELLEILSMQLPDQGGDTVPEHSDVINILHDMEIESGILLDIGSGVGNNASKWAFETDFHVIGTERQFDKVHYPQHWDVKKENLSFVRGDALYLPLADSVVTVAIMENVIQHMTEDALTTALPEIIRVLIPNGMLFIGPEETPDDWTGWIVLRKELNEKTGEYQFNRYTIRQLMQASKKTGK